jgi:hypothetical protein
MLKCNTYWGFVFLSLLLLTGCGTNSGLFERRQMNSSIPFPGYERLSGSDRVLADSLIAYALDHEALYSLMGDLKPMSSVGLPVRFPLGKDSTQVEGQHQVVATQSDSIQTAIAELARWNRVLTALSFDHHQFLLIPFKKTRYGDRYLQILLCRTDLLDSLLRAQAPFFAQWGFVPGTDPAVVLTAIEFEEKHDRYRAYGYLFGYPRHAVDFFVRASQQKQQSGEFVQRSFFKIPVHVRKDGYFTYALPKDFQPLPADSTTYYQATTVLEEYRALRPKYIDKKGQYHPIELYRKWWRRHKKK